MATWKPIQPTEITDVNIIREVIAQIRKPIPPEVYTRIEERDRKLAGVFMQIDPEEMDRRWEAMRQERTETAAVK